MTRPLAILGLAAACGSGKPTGPYVGTPVLVPLLVDAARPYNHSREVTVAAHAGRVVVAAIDEQFASADSFDPGPDYGKRVAIDVSTDAGDSYLPAVDPAIGDQTTDPVVQVGADGTFWLAAWDTSTGQGALARSPDGAAWSAVASGLAIGDKEWIAVDDLGEQVYLGAVGGLWRYGFAGDLRGTAAGPAMMANAYADAAGAHFATTAQSVVRWDGAGASVEELAALDAGADADMYTTVCWSRGALPGGTWSVRARRDAGRSSIVIRVEHGAEVVETPLTAADANALFPAAALDATGRLHVAWYDTSGDAGVLRYTHSVGAEPFADGFLAPIDVDPDALPGAGWYPSFDTTTGGRRLREYIGLAVDGEVVHIAWTHAPAPPSRVYAVAIRP